MEKATYKDTTQIIDESVPLRDIFMDIVNQFADEPPEGQLVQTKIDMDDDPIEPSPQYCCIYFMCYYSQP